MPFSSQNLISIASAFVLAVALTPIVRAAARRLGMVAKPKTDRWHKQPTAMLGGVAIWAAVVLSYIAFIPKTPIGWRIVLASTFLFLVGLLDDLIHTKPYQKLIGQIMGAAYHHLLRHKSALDQLAATEHGAHDLLVDWHHERAEPARQHGWARGRHFGDRFVLSRVELFAHRADYRSRDGLDVRRGAARLFDLQLQSGVDLYG